MNSYTSYLFIHIIYTTRKSVDNGMSTNIKLIQLLTSTRFSYHISINEIKDYF